MRGKANRAIATRFKVVRLDNSGVKIKVCEARTLGGSGGTLPQGNFWDLRPSEIVSSAILR